LKGSKVQCMYWDCNWWVQPMVSIVCIGSYDV